MREKEKKFVIGCIMVPVLASMLLVGTCFIGIALISSPDEPSTEETAEDKRKGFHCLSAWDGHHDGLEALVKGHLNDPDSMKTYETRISPVNADGRHLIVMEFGAKNAFGGMIRNTASGWVDNETCRASLLGIE